MVQGTACVDVPPLCRRAHLLLVAVLAASLSSTLSSAVSDPCLPYFSQPCPAFLCSQGMQGISDIITTPIAF
jgi:hypothetical protein